MDVTVPASTFTTAHYNLVNTTIDQLINGKQGSTTKTPSAGGVYEKATGITSEVTIDIGMLKSARRVLAIATDGNVSDITMEDHDYLMLSLIVGL